MKYTLYRLYDKTDESRCMKLITKNGYIKYISIFGITNSNIPCGIWQTVTSDKKEWKIDNFIKGFIRDDHKFFGSELVKFMTYDELFMEMI